MIKKDEQSENQIEEDIKKFANIVYTIAYANTSSVSDAEDVFQDVFVKYCKYFNRLTDDIHKERWLKKATKHSAINFNKHKKLTQCLELDENILVDTMQEVEEPKVSQLIDYLKDTYKVVLKLYYLNNMHIKEIGKELDITESAVKTRLKRGRRELKEILNKVGFYYE